MIGSYIASALTMKIVGVTMGEFRFKYENRYAETQGYDGFLADKEELNNFFETTVKGKMADHTTVGIDSTKQHIVNVCYDCNIPLWMEIYERVTNIGNKCGVKLNWDEFKHCMRFTFIWMPPGGDLAPHTAAYFRALCAFNIPLRGKTEISFYEHIDNGDAGDIVGPKVGPTHEYFNPSFLNVDRFHGVKNDTPDERMILKTHLMIVPWDKAIQSVEGDEQVNLWDFTVPWQQKHVPLNNKAYSK